MPKPRHSFSIRLGILALPLFARLATATAADLDAPVPPLYREATNQFQSMTSTHYQYQTQVDRRAGVYRYDCVGFVSYALRQAAPEAWASAFRGTHIDKGRIPSPPRYRTFFASLAEQPQPGWQAVTNVADLRRGDVVAWEHKTASAVGHAVILSSTPVKQTNGTWTVEVYDSTSSPHSNDSRLNDERCEVLAATGRRSGLGRGTMAFAVNATNGALTGVCWSPAARPITVPIAAARPLF